MFFLFSTILLAQDIVQKFILESDKNDTIIESKFQDTKKYFQTTTSLQELKDKHNLVLNLESLGSFKIITLSPIKTTKLKNKLLLTLSTKYPDIFALNIKQKTKPKKTHITDLPKKKESTTIETYKKEYSYVLSLEWLTFILLTIISLTLITRSLLQLYKLKKLQQKLKVNHEKLENELQNRGIDNA